MTTEEDSFSEDTGPDDSTPSGSTSGPLGFIGSPCMSHSECDFDGSYCLEESEGFPGGTCSKDCGEVCPDREGHPTTFCVADEEIFEVVVDEGACLSRCDLGVFPGTGCRQGYGCAIVERANDAATVQYACLPGRTSELTSCHLDLSARGVGFEPLIMKDDHPPTHDWLTCHVEEPVRIKSPVHGVDILYYDGTPTPLLTATCDMAHALTDSIDDVVFDGVTAVRHVGTYVCRVIGGTDTLSRHAYGDAIDIWGFDFADGTSYTLIDDWEHETESPVTDGGEWLYETAYRWYDDRYWNIILTPNYNSAHDNHFHVDLTPGSEFIGFAEDYWIGPAPFHD